LVLIGVVLLFFLRPITASHDSQRANAPVQPLQRKRLRVESRLMLLVCVMLILGGAALVIAAL
jgi:hypothetical protein